MATVKPANFPVINRQTVGRPQHGAQSHPAQTLKSQPTQKLVLPTKPGSAVRQTPQVRTSKDEKLEKAIEVLRAKTIQLYHPNRAKVKPAAALGQIIDVKA